MLVAANLITRANPIARACLLACQQKESGAWFSAPPVSALGLRMDSDSIQIAVGLQLGSALCLPHDCAQCEARVDEAGIYALSCRRSQGRLLRHACLNDIIKDALVAVDIPCTLESHGLCREDGRQPDGISIILWARGHCLVWVAMCHDTFARPTSQLPPIIPDWAVSGKWILYSDLANHMFSSLSQWNHQDQLERTPLSFCMSLADVWDVRQKVLYLIWNSARQSAYALKM